MKIKSKVPGDKYTLYWDEGNKHDYPWYKKGWWKSKLKKKYIREMLKTWDKGDF